MAASTVEPRPAPPVAFSRPRVRVQLGRVIALVLVLDAVVLSLAVPVALTLKFGWGNWHPAGIQWLTGVPLIDFGWVVPLWLAVLFVQDAYSRRQFARGADEFKTILKGSVNAALLASVLAYLVNYDMSRGFYLLAFVVGTTLLLGERYAVARIVARARRHDLLMHRVVAVGGEDEVEALCSALATKPELGYEVVGACMTRTGSASDIAVPVVGTPDDAVDACTRLGADTLLVAGGSHVGSAHLRRIGWALEDSDVDLIVVPSLLDVAGPRIHSRPVSGLPFLHIEPPQVARAMKWGKAVFDRVGALLLLVLLSPVFLAVAVAIKVESRGPVFFRHRRIGVDGREFGVWKFRSMAPDAHDRFDDLVADADGSVLLFKVRNDPRITKVGAFIRRYSLDELPQLVNVLVGDMSLVGPRPQIAAEVAEYAQHDHRRLLVRPGMTGLWQVSGRSNLTWDEAVRLDLYYVDNWSMTGDLVILVKTLRAVLRPDGAY
jgi:exopolysaccharide biosynthesis polyprenyl glycosylphosphotransferase